MGRGREGRDNLKLHLAKLNLESSKWKRVIITVCLQEHGRRKWEKSASQQEQQQEEEQEEEEEGGFLSGPVL